MGSLSQDRMATRQAGSCDGGYVWLSLCLMESWDEVCA
jgi:hypothetical protein